MTDDNLDIEHSANAKQNRNTLLDTAKELGLELERVHWSRTISPPLDAPDSKLSLIATSGTDELAFTQAEIEGYHTGHSLARSMQKLGRRLKPLCERQPTVCHGPKTNGRRGWAGRPSGDPHYEGSCKPLTDSYRCWGAQSLNGHGKYRR